MANKTLNLPVTPMKGSSVAPVSPNNTPAEPYFCKRSPLEMDTINDLVEYLKRPLTDTLDGEWGSLYVMNDRNRGMTKVGYTNGEEFVRIAHHMKSCKVQVSKLYQHLGFLGAHKAEQIVHKLLKSFNRWLYNCPCRSKKHTEWYSKTFLDIVQAVQLVCGWLQQKPYIMDGNSYGQLRSEWIETLNHWHATQMTKEPLEWTEFFLSHPTLGRNYPIHLSQSAREDYLRSHSPKVFTPNSADARPAGYFVFSECEDQSNRQHIQSLQKHSKTTTKLDTNGTVVKTKEESLDFQDINIATKAKKTSKRAVFVPKTNVAFRTGEHEEEESSPTTSDFFSADEDQGGLQSESANVKEKEGEAEAQSPSKMTSSYMTVASNSDRSIKGDRIAEPGTSKELDEDPLLSRGFKHHGKLLKSFTDPVVSMARGMSYVAHAFTSKTGQLLIHRRIKESIQTTRNAARI